MEKEQLDFKWYAVQTQSLVEDSAKNLLEERINNKQMNNFFDVIIIPKDQNIEKTKSGNKRAKAKLFPGYIFVKMVLTNETISLVKDTPRIIGFVGGNQNPSPLSDEEINKINKQTEIGIKILENSKYKIGDNVKIVSGSFSGLKGNIFNILTDKNKIEVEIPVFGRNIPIELDFKNVELI
jgi:transcriptional antiterminator NusG